MTLSEIIILIYSGVQAITTIALVEIDGEKVWTRYLLDKGKVPKVAKDNLQKQVNDLLDNTNK